ncbi:Aquaporin Z [Candidatus Phaeomarinobacter ectocarpi]|uniref:Aquaporin Z n=1 Tax=Candidatus Phaeomarinibacter ectocarpi TaxID=1458461 RepID=X5MMS1_9HYPH|nr:MIP/aquaporin family protein [Candidatus Phaeomarinobacter ectocarpi]CDO59481.1 Aquaporin Z [Candidatus Phaeomarinobacter ectocarpi]
MSDYTMARRLAAEAAGTAILVGTVVGSGIMGVALASGNDAVALLGNTIATGAILVVLIMVFGPVSGAHFNPAVTFAFWLKRDITLAAALAYIVVQVTGGLVGTGLAHAMFELDIVQASTHVRAGPPQWLGEFLATFALLASILALLKTRPEAIPYAVGLVITAGYWWTSSTSFANPAVTIARAFTDTFAGIRPDDVGPFIAAQLIAAASAVGFFAWMYKSK